MTSTLSLRMRAHGAERIGEMQYEDTYRLPYGRDGCYWRPHLRVTKPSRAEPRLQCSIASMASTTWRTASFSLSVRWGFQQSINRIKRGWSERFQASCS
jgi:hypothetical protein